jgi:hypothetical protein
VRSAPVIALLFLACGKGSVLPSGEGVAGVPSGLALLDAAKSFGNVEHDFVLDPTSALVPGRGLEKTAAGAWKLTPLECATAKQAGVTAEAATTDIDFSYVGLAVDSTLVGADADLSPYFAAGAEASVHTLRLTAIAIVRDRDPQFFRAGTSLRMGEGACECGRATHFASAVKYGGMLAYETTVRKSDVHASALGLFRARLAANDGTVKQVSIGGLVVTGLDAAGKGTYAPLSFKVNKPVPVAYATYPVSDVCEFAFPEPDVSPSPLDFGAVSGAPAERLLHVQSRAPIDSLVTYNELTVMLPAEGSVDIPVRWSDTSAKQGCHLDTREEALQVRPKDSAARAVPKELSVRISERALTGAPVAVQREHLDSGEARRPDYAATNKTYRCPEHYVPSACRVENAACADGKGCTIDGYVVRSERTQEGCHFECAGPTSYLIGKNACRFDAITECVQSCTVQAP